MFRLSTWWEFLEDDAEISSVEALTKNSFRSTNYLSRTSLENWESQSQYCHSKVTYNNFSLRRRNSLSQAKVAMYVQFCNRNSVWLWLQIVTQERSEQPGPKHVLGETLQANWVWNMWDSGFSASRMSETTAGIQSLEVTWSPQRISPCGEVLESGR